MERILALQGLSEFSGSDEVAFDSNLSIGCSDASSGAGGSSCSIGCKEAEQLDW